MVDEPNTDPTSNLEICKLIADIHETHTIDTFFSKRKPLCRTCGTAWPCSYRRLADEVERLGDLNVKAHHQIHTLADERNDAVAEAEALRLVVDAVKRMVAVALDKEGFLREVALAGLRELIDG